MKELSFEEFQLLTVDWRDAHHDFDSESGRLPYDDYIVRTVGQYLSHNNLFLSMAMEILPEASGYRGVTHIPLVLIQAINGEKV